MPEYCPILAGLEEMVAQSFNCSLKKKKKRTHDARNRALSSSVEQTAILGAMLHRQPTCLQTIHPTLFPQWHLIDYSFQHEEPACMFSSFWLVSQTQVTWKPTCSTSIRIRGPLTGWVEGTGNKLRSTFTPLPGFLLTLWSAFLHPGLMAKLLRWWWQSKWEDALTAGTTSLCSLLS